MALHTGSLNTCLSGLTAQGKQPAMGALGSGSSVKEKQEQKHTWKKQLLLQSDTEVACSHEILTFQAAIDNDV